jgi:phage anti-repressor protein
MKDLRYKIVDTIHISLIKGHPSTWVDTGFSNENDKVLISSNQIYFVDILERYKAWAKLHIYMPDGTFREGWQSIYYVMLHEVGDIFDGRFNTDKEKDESI